MNCPKIGTQNKIESITYELIQDFSPRFSQFLHNLEWWMVVSYLPP